MNTWLARFMHGASIGAGVGALGLGIGAVPGSIIGGIAAVAGGAYADWQAQRAAESSLPGNTLPLPAVEVEPVVPASEPAGS